MNIQRWLQKSPSSSGWMLFIVCIAWLVFCLSDYPRANFPSEEIDIQVYAAHVLVNGLYVYKNPFPFPITQGFSIPLPVDESHPEPLSLSAAVLTTQEEPVPLYFIFGKYRFTLTFRAKETIRLLVRYYQYAPSQDARYILTTTQAWKQPLHYGRYTLRLHNVRLVASNYPLRHDGSRCHVFERLDFMPQQDWRFSWTNASI